MKTSLVRFLCACGATALLRAQIPIIPATPVEQTHTPVFADFKPSPQAQTLPHAEPLANFRLRLEYRLPNAASRLAVKLHPQRTVELQAADAAQWQTLDLQ